MPTHRIALVLASVLLATCALHCSSESGPDANGAAGAGGAAAGGAGGMGGSAGASGTTPADDGAAPDAPVPDAALSDSSGPDTAESVCRAAVLAQCARFAQCGMSTYGPCALTANACPNYYFDTGSTRTVQSSAQCVGKLESMSCNEYALSILPACASAGTLATGAPCRFGTQCESTVCNHLGSACGTCAPVVPVGSPCTVASACAVGSFCDAGSGRCTLNTAAVLGDENAPCNTSPGPPRICSGNLVCTGGLCRQPPGAGQPCAADAFRGQRCAPGLVCQTGTCISPDDCAGTNCDANSFCDRTASPPQCKAYAALGQSCAATNDQCTPPLRCIIANDGSAAKCGPGPAQLGEPCSATRSCESMLECSNGQCVSASAALCQ